MLVRDRMTLYPFTVGPDTPLLEATRIMKERRVRRLPVVGRGKLVGIITQTDVARASPSPVTTLSIWEMHDLVAKVKVRSAMTRNPVTVTPDTPIEVAAFTMRDKKVGGLPVVEDGHVVGIITESDIFDAFIELMGLRYEGTRLVVGTSQPAGLFELVKGLHAHGILVRNLLAYPTPDGLEQIVLRVTVGDESAVSALEEEAVKRGDQVLLRY